MAAAAQVNSAVAALNEVIAINEEECKEAVRRQNLYEAEEDRALSTQEIKAMIDRTAEYADSNYFSSLGDLSRHMQNTIS